jgi:hypothetical protein
MSGLQRQLAAAMRQKQMDDAEIARLRIQARAASILASSSGVGDSLHAAQVQPRESSPDNDAADAILRRGASNTSTTSMSSALSSRAGRGAPHDLPSATSERLTAAERAALSDLPLRSVPTSATLPVSASLPSAVAPPMIDAEHSVLSPGLARAHQLRAVARDAAVRRTGLSAASAAATTTATMATGTSGSAFVSATGNHVTSSAMGLAAIQQARSATTSTTTTTSSTRIVSQQHVTAGTSWSQQVPLSLRGVSGLSGTGAGAGVGASAGVGAGMSTSSGGASFGRASGALTLDSLTRPNGTN